jgi:putative transposase
LAYHVLNRATGRGKLFEKDADYQAFGKALLESWERLGTRVLCFCIMPSHWHLVLWPRHDGELSEFMRWLTVTHAQRWHAHRHSAGTGPVYQGRFKSFPIQQDDHLLRVCRYVERNALRARLVVRAEAWPWGSLWLREHKGADLSPLLLPMTNWPVKAPRNWVEVVNQAEGQDEFAALRQSARRGAPYGNARWTNRTATRLGLESSLRPRGRPRARLDAAGSAASPDASTNKPRKRG